MTEKNSIEKNSIAIRMSEEMWLDSLAMKYGGDFCRKIASRTGTPPTEAEWAKYREAVDLLAKLEDNPYWEDGGTEYGSRIQEPEPSVHYEYAETQEEYAARVRSLNPADYESAYDRLIRQAMTAFAKESNR